MEAAGIQPVPPKVAIQGTTGERRRSGDDGGFQRELDRNAQGDRPGAEPDEETASERPVARRLQPGRPAIRKDDGDGILHVDVIA